jgi:hypothetical protein
MRISDCGRCIPGTESNSIEAELFADRLRERVLDLSVPRYRRNSPVHWIRLKIVICTLTFQVAVAFSEVPHQLPPFHSEIAISCLSLGTNVFSEASSTIKRYASRIIA